MLMPTFFHDLHGKVAPWPRFFSHGRENFLDVMAGAALDESTTKDRGTRSNGFARCEMPGSDR
jgi:hypothetical protein